MLTDFYSLGLRGEDFLLREVERLWPRRGEDLRSLRREAVERRPARSDSY